MVFDIRKFIDIPSDRTTGNIHLPCLNCQSSDTNNPALSVNLDTGAYHCFKCEGEKNGEIRNALGQGKNQIVPTNLVKATSQKTTVSPDEIRDNHDKLMRESRLGKSWLLERGFSLEMISHYKLGIKRCKRLEKLWWAITIPIPADNQGTKYYQKLRIQPWTKDDRPKQLHLWGQKGIEAMVWFTYLPDRAVETYLCEGEWDAMLLGWIARETESAIAVATFTCGCDTVPPQSQLDRLPGRVTIFYDRNDKPNPKGERPGEKGAKKVALSLGDRAFIAQVPQSDKHEAIQGWDVSDSINAGFGFGHFQASAFVAIGPKLEKASNSLGDRVMTNDQLMARAPDYIDWLVPDMLPTDELFVLAASPRAGKSLLAMALARAVATGDKFLGRPVTQGNVLYVNLEDSEAKIKQRELAQEWEQNLPIYWLDRFKLSDMDSLREIAEELNIRLIVLDTLSRIRDDQKQETSAEMSKVLEPLQQMAMDLKLAVLLIHHTTKITVENAGSANVFDTIRGSSAIRGVARGAWILAANERCFRLCVEHGFGDKQDLEILLDPENLIWRVVRPWNPRSSNSQVDQILGYLKTVGAATIPEIASVLNVNPNCLTTALWRLQVNNSVWKEPGKKYNPAIYHLTDTSLPNKAGDVRQLLGNQDAYTVSIPGDDLTHNNIYSSEEKGIRDSTEKVSKTDEIRGSADTNINNSDIITPETDTTASDSDTLIPETDTAIKNREKYQNAQKPLPDLKVGDFAKWIGGQGAMSVICRGKQLKVLEIRNEDGSSARVRADSWAVDYWVSTECLRRV